MKKCCHRQVTLQGLKNLLLDFAIANSALFTILFSAMLMDLHCCIPLLSSAREYRTLFVHALRERTFGRRSIFLKSNARIMGVVR